MRFLMHKPEKKEKKKKTPRKAVRVVAHYRGAPSH